MTTRRTILGSLGAGLALGSEALAQGAAAGSPPPPAFAGRHEPKPLPFDPAKLRGLSERLLRSHWENNYVGAVKALNAVEQRLEASLADSALPPFVHGNLKREELLRSGSVVLHEHYFANLGGDGQPAGAALELIRNAFGSRDRWELEFRRTAMSLAGGSGWVILGLNLHTGVAHNYWAWDHAHSAALAVPLLVMDLYEHAYHLDFGAGAAAYLDAFLANVDWAEVGRRAEWVAKARRA